MLYRRIVAFALDLLMLAVGGLAGFALGMLSVQSSNTIAGMGNVVVFFILAAGGCVLAWIALAGLTAATGRSPGQRIMGLGYNLPVARWQRVIHYALAWLVPVVLIAAPALTLNALGNYRNELQRAISDLQQSQTESQAGVRDYEKPRDHDEKRNTLERKLKRADWFAPEWLVGNDDLPWMLVMYGPLLIYWLLNISLLRREPRAAVHDRIAGVRIVRS